MLLAQLRLSARTSSAFLSLSILTACSAFAGFSKPRQDLLCTHSLSDARTALPHVRRLLSCTQAAGDAGYAGIRQPVPVDEAASSDMGHITFIHLYVLHTHRRHATSSGHVHFTA